MIQPIVLFNPNNSMLRGVIAPVDTNLEKDQIESLIADMKDTLDSVGGLGLAANQLGFRKRICLAKIGDEVIPMVNPTITWNDGVEEDSTEACLSLPDVVCKVKRWKTIRVSYIEPTTYVERELQVEFPNSVVVQHEVDHLDGKLIIDDLTPTQRTLIATKLKRISRGTVPIHYVGLAWKESRRSWTLVGNLRKLNELKLQRLLNMIEAYNESKSNENKEDEETNNEAKETKEANQDQLNELV